MSDSLYRKLKGSKVLQNTRNQGTHCQGLTKKTTGELSVPANENAFHLDCGVIHMGLYNLSKAMEMKMDATHCTSILTSMKLFQIKTQ